MEMNTLGYNYRLTEIQAALALSQLNRAENGIRRRVEIARKYYDSFKSKPYIKGQSKYIEGHAYHLYIIEVVDRLGLYNYLHKNKVYVQIHYIPCHLMPYYRDKGWKEGDRIKVESYYKKCLSLPIFPTLNDTEQEKVIFLINKYYEK